MLGGTWAGRHKRFDRLLTHPSRSALVRVVGILQVVILVASIVAPNAVLAVRDQGIHVPATPVSAAEASDDGTIATVELAAEPDPTPEPTATPGPTPTPEPEPKAEPTPEPAEPDATVTPDAGHVP